MAIDRVCTALVLAPSSSGLLRVVAAMHRRGWEPQELIFAQGVVSATVTKTGLRARSVTTILGRLVEVETIVSEQLAPGGNGSIVQQRLITRVRAGRGQRPPVTGAGLQAAGGDDGARLRGLW